jgi:cell division septal protein FtsQ
MRLNVIRLLIIASALASVGMGFFYVSYFRVSSIKTNTPIPSSYVDELQKQTVPLLNIEAVKSELMRRDPLIAEVSVEKKYPSGLIITVKKTTPAALLKNGSLYVELDRSGRVLSVSKKENKKLMLISFYQTIPDYELVPGRTLKRDEVLYAVRLIHKLDINGFHLQSISVTAPSVITLTGETDEPVVLLSTKKDIDKNLVLMHNSIKALTISGEKASVINLQFSKPFIEYENNSGN